MNEPDLIRQLVVSPVIAVIGVSADPSKPSHYVTEYLQQLGHRILPVNPLLTEVLGVPCYPSLADLPVKPDLIDVFRLPKFIPDIVDEMIALGLSALWLQQGIIHPEATARAEAHGIRVVADHCLMVESRRAGLEPGQLAGA